MTPSFSASTIIRDALEADLPACEGLDLSYETDYVWQVDVRDEAGAIVTSFRTARLPRPMHVVYPREAEALEAAISPNPHTVFLISETFGQVSGYLIMHIDVGRCLGWITDVTVGRAWRRQRVGTALLAEAYQRAQEHQLRRLVMETQSKNYPGICFCQKNGMVFCGFNDRYFPNHDIALFFGQNIR